MSFSSKVKEEMSKSVSSARHCQLAELAAMIEFGGRISFKPGGFKSVDIDTDNEDALNKFGVLLKKTYDIEASESVSDDKLKALLEGLRLMDASGAVKIINGPVSQVLLKQSCCKRAFLRGAYLCRGSMSDPKGSYHLEIVCDTMAQASQLTEVLSDFELEAKIVERKSRYVVYIKEGESIVDFLGICEAHVALMEMENDRIVKEVRGTVNRRVNCEAANITKTVNAAARQIEDIEYLRDTCGLDSLPDNLKEMALIRLEYPDATLPELGKVFNPPLGKSGVNHRLRRLNELADRERIHG